MANRSFSKFIKIIFHCCTTKDPNVISKNNADLDCETHASIDVRDDLHNVGLNQTNDPRSPNISTISTVAAIDEHPPGKPLRRTFVYIGGGWDVQPLLHDWSAGADFHYVDGQPNSEFGTKKYYPEDDTERMNRFCRPNFVNKVLEELRRVGFECITPDQLTTTNILLDDEGCGDPIVVVFMNSTTNIRLFYHFNTSAPEHVDDLMSYIGSYEGLICAGHSPHKSIVAHSSIANNSLTFHGYAGTWYWPNDVNEPDGVNSDTITNVIPIDQNIWMKFAKYIYHDTNGDSHDFTEWGEFLNFQDNNPELTRHCSDVDEEESDEEEDYEEESDEEVDEEVDDEEEAEGELIDEEIQDEAEADDAEYDFPHDIEEDAKRSID